jgi:hypothetical protein
MSALLMNADPRVLAAIFGALGIVLGAVTTAAFSHRRERMLQENKIFFESLEWLTKGRQRRNVGIAAIAAFQKNKRLRTFSIPLLIGTAIYLLRESSKDEKADKEKADKEKADKEKADKEKADKGEQSGPNTTEHDLYNMDRIMRLLLRITDKQSKKQVQELKADYERLLEILNSQESWSANNSTKGLKVTPTDLTGWQKQLKEVLKRKEVTLLQRYARNPETKVP